MISHPVFSIFLCFPLFSGTWRTLDLSIPWCCLPISYYIPSVTKFFGGGGAIYWNHGVCLFMCPDFVWTISNEPLKLGIVVYYHELECHAKKLVCYLQGQDHSEGIYNHSITISTVSSKLLIHLQPNLVWWYIILSQSILWKIGLLYSRSRSQLKIKMSMNDCPNYIFWTTKQFVTKLCMTMHHC